MRIFMDVGTFMKFKKGMDGNYQGTEKMGPPHF